MRWLLLGYMFLVVHRPFEVWPSLGEFRIEWYYMLLTGGIWLVYPGKRWLPNWLHVGFALLATAICSSWLLSPWSTEIDGTVEVYFKQLVFYLLLVTLIQDERGLRQMVLGFLVFMMLYMGHSLLEYANGRHVFRMKTMRMIGVDRTLGDPNAFAATIVYGLPLVAAFWRSGPSKWLRCFLLGYVAVSILCVLLTGSRTGFVGLVFLLAVWSVNRASWWRLAIPLVCLSPVIWLALPDSLQNRFLTIVNPDVGPANAKVSADSRMEGFVKGFELLSRYPATGVGPSAFGLAIGHGMKAHNLYGQTAGELGLVGLLAFAAILIGFLRIHLGLRRHCAGMPPATWSFSAHLIHAISMTVVLLLLMGWGGHNLYRYTWIWYGAFGIIGLHCLRTQTARLAERTSHDELVRRWNVFALPSFGRGGAVAGWRNSGYYPAG